MAGATGVLGRRVVARAIAAGHGVSGAARSPRAATILHSLGAEAAMVDLFDASAVRAAVNGHDAVLNLATAIPSVVRAPWPRAFAANDALYGIASRHLIDAARVTGVARFVRKSITMTYPDRGSSWINETVPLEPEAHQSSVVRAEADTDHLRSSGVETVVLRFGFFYGPDARHSREEIWFVRRLRVSTVVGANDGYLSVIHVDDAADATIAALEVPSGVYNVVDDDPLTHAEHARAVASALGVRTPWRLPASLTRRAGPAARAMMRSQRVSNSALRTASNWRPDHRNAHSGWQAIAEGG